ncbi:MAG TPA: AraC family transcriptional regulator [Planctomycetota bacterium]|nr:AraC family transcriptional regulator [Planctomycetota bacterium]
MPRFFLIGRATLSESQPHHHSTWEISVYTHGSGRAWVGDHEFTFGPGTIVCYPPVLDHKEFSPEPFTEFYIHTDALTLGPDAVPIFKDTPAETVTRLAGLLNDEFHRKEPGWQSATQDLFDLIIGYLNRWRQGTNTHPLVERLKHMLIENLQNSSFQVGEALNQLPLSPDHLRELFEKTTGKTPLKYLTEIRINEARNLLRQGYSVKESGIRAGYPDPYYFSRIFHKTTGLRPSEYARSRGRA